MGEFKSVNRCNCVFCEMHDQCKNCKGTGFIYYGKSVTCNKCNGIKCIYCKESGLKRMPYDLCEKCYGDGQFKKVP